jgi:hypothetical protein
MKVGDLVDVMTECGGPTHIEWDGPWTVEIVGKDSAVVFREIGPGRYYAGDGKCRRKALFRTLRPHEPSCDTSIRSRLPKPGAAVFFALPNKTSLHPWKFGIVVEQHKKSIKVLHGTDLINRNRNQFIEVEVGS